MKKIAIAFGLSLALVLLYYFVAYVISPFILGTGPLSPHPVLYAPISLPYAVYSFAAPDAIQNLLTSIPGGSFVEGLLFLVVNAMILSVPLYAVIRLIPWGQR